MNVPLFKPDCCSPQPRDDRAVEGEMMEHGKGGWRWLDRKMCTALLTSVSVLCSSKCYEAHVTPDPRSSKMYVSLRWM